MGTKLIAKGADFRAAPLGLVPPVVRGLQFIDVFDQGAAAVGRNLALGGVVSSRVGAPTAGASFVDMAGQTNYVQTAALVSASWTHFVVMAPLSEAAAGGLIANSGQSVAGLTGTSLGSSLVVQPGTASDGKVTLTAWQARADGGAVVSTAASLNDNANLNVPIAVSGRYDHTTGQVRVTNQTTGQTIQSTSALPPAYNGPLRVGSDYSASRTAGVRMYMAATFNVRLSDDEMALLYAWAKAMLQARHGVTI